MSADRSRRKLNKGHLDSSLARFYEELLAKAQAELDLANAQNASWQQQRQRHDAA